MSPATPIDTRIDSPTYTVMDAVAIPASGTATSDVVDCLGWERIGIVYTFNRGHNRTVEVSDDGASWYSVATAGPNTTPNANTVGGGTLNAVGLFNMGWRFVRLKIQNTDAANAGTATARISLQ